MKIIKRDGRVVDYDRQKISIAIEKSNKEVKEKQKASKDTIKSIINYIEDLNKKRMLVEDIQDIIEQQLMELGKYELAKKYIVYRYTRALVRKQNTTDQSILGIIRNENSQLPQTQLNNNTLLASSQRDYIASEVSKDLTKRLLLPEKIVKADEKGILHFHDANYFVQPIFNCCIVNLGDMLDNGTVINQKLIKSPQTFLTACIVTTQIIATISSNQYGGQSLSLKHLGKYLRKSYTKLKKDVEEKYKNKLSDDTIENIIQNRLQEELTLGIQTIQYQINTFMATNGQSPFITLFLELSENDQYQKENAMIIQEILNQRIKGIQNENGIYVTPLQPNLVYVLDEQNCLKGGKYDYLTKLAIECSLKRLSPNYISAKKMRENYKNNVFSPMGCRNFLSPWKDENGNYKFEGRFNQGIVSINLPQIAIIADGNENDFWKLLDERLELCKEALMCRHYALVGTSANISPIHWRHGAIARLKENEKIDNLLYNGYSTMSLGYIGIYEMTKLLKGISHTTVEGHDFAIKVMNYLKQTINNWKKETNIDFTLYGTPSNSLCYKFAKIDKENFGTIKDITDKGYYTNSYHIDYREKIDVFDKLLFESEFQSLSCGGSLSFININEIPNDIPFLEKVIRFIYDNIQYVQFTNNENKF